MWVSFCCCFVLGGGRKSISSIACACVWNLEFKGEKKTKQKNTQVAQKPSFFVLDLIWERNSAPKPSSFPFFSTPSPPQGEAWVRFSKEGKGASSAFVSVNCQLCLVLYHFVFSIPCYLVSLVLCWIDDKEGLVIPPPPLPSHSSSSPCIWKKIVMLGWKFLICSLEQELYGRAWACSCHSRMETGACSDHLLLCRVLCPQSQDGSLAFPAVAWRSSPPVSSSKVLLKPVQ